MAWVILVHNKLPGRAIVGRGPVLATQFGCLPGELEYLRRRERPGAWPLTVWNPLSESCRPCATPVEIRQDPVVREP